MTNATRFLNAFIAVEQYLADYLNAQQHLSFSTMVDRASRTNSAVKRVAADLKQYADLRNAIVHDRRDDAVLAEPIDAVVTDLERIATLLREPPTVFPLFRADVVTVNASDSLAHAVKMLQNRSIGQLPVLDGQRCIGLLSSITIVHWLGWSLQHDQDHADLSAVSISAVLKHTEHPDNYAMIARASPVTAVLDAFERANERGLPLEALLITEHGRANQSIIGIVTVADIPVALAALDQHT